MLATLLAPALARRGVHYGWVMVAVTFLVAVASAGSMGMLGALLLPLHDAFGWEISTISGALALRLLLFGAIAPFAAALILRYGLRRTVAVALGFVVVGLLASMGMTASWQVWLFWGLLTGIGTGMTALVMGATVATRWFVQRRGLVLGMLTAANATGQLAFLPLGAWLAEHHGWRAGLLPGILGCTVAALAMWLFGCDYPAELGQLAFGDKPGTPLQAAAPAARGNPVRAALAALAEASGNRVFWVLFATFVVCGLSTNGLVQTHFIPLCVDFGLPQVAAASVLAMMGAFDFVGTIVSGWLSDRFDNRYLLCWYYGLRGLSLLLLPYSGFTFYGLSIFAVFYGLDWVATVPPTVKLAGMAFGRDRTPVVFGWIFAAHQLGAAVAAAGGGLTRDNFGTYLPAFYLAGATCLIAAALALAARRKVMAVA